MPRMYYTQSALEGTLYLEPEEAHHIRDVLRLRPGDGITVCDGRGFQAQAVLLRVSKTGVEAEVAEVWPADTEPDVKIFAYPSLSKGDRFPWTLQKLSELGVSEIIPVLSARCVARELGEAKLERFRRIALEAAKQCGRAVLPVVHELRDYKAVVEQAVRENAVKLFCYEETRFGLKAALQAASFTQAHILTGPEGGYSPEEAESALQNGWKAVSLGKNILRCETAPLCAVSAVLYEKGDM